MKIREECLRQGTGKCKSPREGTQVCPMRNVELAETGKMRPKK